LQTDARQPLILLVVVISFFLIQMAPGSFVEIMTSEMQLADPDVIEQLRVTYGLDQPLYVQLFKYIWALLHLDFGFSYRQNVPVIEAVLDHLPATLILMLSSLAIAVLVGVGAGALAASKANSLWDRLISLIAAVCFAAPSFWVGIMLIVLFSVKLGWLPVGDMQSIGASKGIISDGLDILRHLALPAVSLGLLHAAIYIRVTRSSMLDIANADFVRTARAKGLSQGRVTLAHILRNALLPVVTLVGLQFGQILSGSVVIETVFSWPGIGNLLFDAVMTRDYPVVLGILVLGSLVTIFANLAVDLLYVRLDPRVSLE
jgi:peptide/nickel transport system permease protein